ncbi:MAG: hypothetical protein JNK23_22630 [Opitutaceae bacterium]|nr:hypothetical protein [Opitutaceae bacterium]
MRELSPITLGVWLCLLALVAPRLAAAEVEVSTVRFSNVRAPNGATGTWLEAEIALQVKPAPGAVGQMVPRVRVAMLMAFELPGPAGGERRLESYRADAECVALEPGRAHVRFYLPPELVKRDQLHGDPKFWGVELTAAGRPQPPERSAYSTTLTSAEQRKNFQAKAGSTAAANDGVLVPQYLTPFALEYPRATPSFVRRDAR